VCRADEHPCGVVQAPQVVVATVHVLTTRQERDKECDANDQVQTPYGPTASPDNSLHHAQDPAPRTGRRALHKTSTAGGCRSVCRDPGEVANSLSCCRKWLRDRRFLQQASSPTSRPSVANSLGTEDHCPFGCKAGPAVSSAPPPPPSAHTAAATGPSSLRRHA
jgi:hypothetical protein